MEGECFGETTTSTAGRAVVRISHGTAASMTGKRLFFLAFSYIGARGFATWGGQCVLLRDSRIS